MAEYCYDPLKEHVTGTARQDYEMQIILVRFQGLRQLIVTQQRRCFFHVKAVTTLLARASSAMRQEGQHPSVFPLHHNSTTILISQQHCTHQPVQVRYRVKATLTPAEL